MRAVVQRVASASVAIAGEQTASIGKGLMVLLGVETGDTPKDAAYIAEKLLHLRIFEDAITFKIALMVVKYMKYMDQENQ